MEKGFSGETVSQRIINRLEWIQAVGEGTVGGALQLKLIWFDEEKGEYRFQSQTQDFMRNVIGTLHGGSAAVMVDQAMGCVANCLFADETHAPTSQMSLNFHRPMIAGNFFLVHVRVVSVSRSLIHMAADVYTDEKPDKLCISSSAIFFRGKKKEDIP